MENICIRIRGKEEYYGGYQKQNIREKEQEILGGKNLEIIVIIMNILQNKGKLEFYISY